MRMNQLQSLLEKGGRPLKVPFVALLSQLKKGGRPVKVSLIALLSGVVLANVLIALSISMSQPGESIRGVALLALVSVPVVIFASVLTAVVCGVAALRKTLIVLLWVVPCALFLVKLLLALVSDIKNYF